MGKAWGFGLAADLGIAQGPTTRQYYFSAIIFFLFSDDDEAHVSYIFKNTNLIKINAPLFFMLISSPFVSLNIFMIWNDAGNMKRGYIFISNI